MLDFLTANWGTILIGAGVAAIVVLIIVKLHRDKKRGRSGCGCGCAGCPSAGMCSGETKDVANLKEKP